MGPKGLLHHIANRLPAMSSENIIDPQCTKEQNPEQSQPPGPRPPSPPSGPACSDARGRRSPKGARPTLPLATTTMRGRSQKRPRSHDCPFPAPWRSNRNLRSFEAPFKFNFYEPTKTEGENVGFWSEDFTPSNQESERQFGDQLSDGRWMNKWPADAPTHLHFTYVLSIEALFIKTSLNHFGGISSPGDFVGMGAINGPVCSLQFTECSGSSRTNRRLSTVSCVTTVPSFSPPHDCPRLLLPPSSPQVRSAVVMASNRLLKTKPIVILLNPFILFIFFSFPLSIYFHQDHGYWILLAFPHFPDCWPVSCLLPTPTYWCFLMPHPMFSSSSWGSHPTDVAGHPSTPPPLLWVHICISNFSVDIYSFLKYSLSLYNAPKKKQQ